MSRVEIEPIEGLHTRQGQRNIRKRIWMGTVWLQEDIEIIKNLNYKFLIISDDDHTEDEQLHWHCVIQFKNARVRPRTRTAHWEVPRSIIEAVEYCKEKGENYFMDGDLGLNTSDKSDWKSFVNACKTMSTKELIDSEFSKTYANYRGFAGEVKIQFSEIQPLEELDNFWIYGMPGTGKTTHVWSNYGESLFIKPINKWWDGYNEEATILLDDWDVTHRMLCYHLKIWGDKWPFTGEIKGGSRRIRPKRIIVTSNYSIDECFDNEQDVAAIKRRFKIIHYIGYNNYHFE